MVLRSFIQMKRNYKLDSSVRRADYVTTTTTTTAIKFTLNIFRMACKSLQEYIFKTKYYSRFFGCLYLVPRALFPGFGGGMRFCFCKVSIAVEDVTTVLTYSKTPRLRTWAQLFEGRLALNPGLNLTLVSFSGVLKHFLG